MTTNNAQTWNITLDSFDAPQNTLTWNRTIMPSFASPLYSQSIFASNVPFYLQKGFYDSTGTYDKTIVSSYFVSKANEIISRIVRSRKVLEVVVFTDLPISVQTNLRNAVYESIEWLLSGSGTFNAKIAQSNIQVDGLNIDSTITDTTTISQLLGTKGYTTFINSNIQSYEYDEASQTLYINNEEYYAHFKTKEVLGDVEIDTQSIDALLTRKSITELLGQVATKGKVAILSTDDILNIVNNYDTFIKANYPSGYVPELGNSIDIQYTGTDTIYINPSILENYIYDGTNWLITSSNYLTRQSIFVFSQEIENALEVANSKVDASEVLIDDAELIAWEGTNY